MIQNQIKLPIKVAFTVAMQGIQVRFWRSVVTVTGVMLGIAFLMAILTGQVVKNGVNDEEAMRNEVRRMVNFLVAEMGPPKGRTIAMVQVGVLNEAEQRLVARLDRDRPQAMRLAAVDGVAISRALPAGVQMVGLAEVGIGANALLVLGDGDASGLNPAAILREAALPAPCCYSRRTQLGDMAAQAEAPEELAGGVAQVKTVLLERQVQEDELQRLKDEASRNRVRSIWIVVISMLVTVIGITNSMLMSVTERFREIGTMKCLGAMGRFIRQLFLIESSLIGLVGAILGAIVGLVFSLVAYTFTYQALVFQSLNLGMLALYFAGSVLIGVFLAVLAALYPAAFASNMLPAHALRSTI